MAWVVVDSKYCTPVGVEMAVVRGEKTLIDGDFLITYIKGNILFKPNSGLHKGYMILSDGFGSPVLTMRKEEKISDFRVKGTWFKRSCVVYAGESDTIVAEMQKKPKDNFSVIVYPNVDSAIMASLVIILDHLIRQDRAHAAAHVALHVALEIVAPPIAPLTVLL